MNEYLGAQLLLYIRQKILNFALQTSWLNVRYNSGCSQARLYPRIYSFSRFVCRDLGVFVPIKRARLAAFFHSLLFGLQFDAVEIVEGHLMSVSSKDVHATGGVHVSRVSITSCRLSTDHSELSAFFHGRAEALSSLQTSLLSLSHALVVGIESRVGVSDDKGLLHRDRGRAGQSIFLFSIFTSGFLLARRLVALSSRHGQIHRLSRKLANCVSLRGRGALSVIVRVSKSALSSNGRAGLAIVMRL